MKREFVAPCSMSRNLCSWVLDPTKPGGSWRCRSGVFLLTGGEEMGELAMALDAELAI
jgi:hypothetical protein